MSLLSKFQSPDDPCPECDFEGFIGVEYTYGEKERYDGVSEWMCSTCGARFGRWTHRKLGDGEIERRFGGAP